MILRIVCVCLLLLLATSQGNFNVNLIKNGDFSWNYLHLLQFHNRDCPINNNRPEWEYGGQLQIVKVYNYGSNGSIWLTTNIFPGWETGGQVQQGFGNVYNHRWGRKVVIELDANINSAIKQHIHLISGLYNLKIRYAARTDRVNTSAFSVSWNGKTVRNIHPINEQIHQLNLGVSANDGANVIQIRGEGTNDSYGMTIGDVSLFLIQPNFPNFPNFQNLRPHLPKTPL